jgi:lipopolysaccharide transport system ATP-binding protein
MRPAIRVDGLSKKYLIGATKGAPPRQLREAISEGAKGLLNRLTGQSKNGRPGTNESSDREFWALKDVSFEVQAGEVVGVIGHNGAGKSTLLKILSRITEPTTGRAEVRGRMGSLLEVGTGFHPELTGRENIYMNGSILGMSRREITQKFDEVVAFSEIERFLDTPVKRYSSGMYVRLAFAVAAHLEPEILIVDEVLAVGDVQFQKKCLGKMGDLTHTGRTIIFVSHNMSAIQNLCTRAIFLQNGTVVTQGNVHACVQAYLGESRKVDGTGTVDLDCSEIVRHGTAEARFSQIDLMDTGGAATGTFQFGQPMRVRLTIRAKVPIRGVILGFSFVASDGTEIQGTTAHDSDLECDLCLGLNKYECIVNPQVLTPGKYSIRAAIFRREECYDYIHELICFSIDASRAKCGTGPKNHYVGYTYLPYQWIRLGD